MAKLPTIKRLTMEDFQGEKSWIDKLLYPLNLFMGSMVSALTNNLTLADNCDAQLAFIQVKTMNTITPGSAYATATSKTFLDANVSTGTDQINMASHGFVTGNRVQLSTSGTLPSPLVTLTDYWVILVDSSHFKVATSLANAYAGTNVDITSASGGGTHTLTLWDVLPNYVPLYQAVKFTCTTKAKPLGVSIWSCVEASSVPSVLKRGIAVDWNYASGSITINNLAGLEPAKTYNVTLLVNGG